MLLKLIISRRCVQTPLRRAPACCSRRYVSSNSNTETSNNKKESSPDNSKPAEMPKKKKTMAEIDEELRQKMANMSGDGGDSGVEYEDGKPVSMKRSVKNNMFRYI